MYLQYIFLTVILDGDFVLKVDKCGKLVDGKFNFNLLVRDLDKLDVLGVDHVVHDLQTLEHSGEGFDVFIFVKEDEDISFFIQDPDKLSTTFLHLSFLPVQHPRPHLLNDAWNLQSVLIHDPRKHCIRIIQISFVEQKVSIPVCQMSSRTCTKMDVHLNMPRAGNFLMLSLDPA